MSDEPDGSSTSVTFDRLVQAAYESFVTEGFERARVQDIAERAGFTTGAIYSRFDSKASLLTAVIAQRGASFLEGALIDLAAEPGRESLRGLARGTQRGPGNDLHRLLIDAAAIANRDEQVRGELRGLLDGVRAALRRAIMEGQSRGSIDSDLDVDAVVHLALTLMAGSFVLKALTVDQPSEQGVDQLTDRLAGMLTTDNGHR